MLHERGVTLLWLQVIPAASRPFGAIQPLYGGGKPLSGLTPHEAEEALAKAALAIYDAARQAQSPDSDYEACYWQAVVNACDQMTLYAAYGLSSETR